MSCDILLINPGDKKNIFQDLSNNISAIEPPYWVGALANFLIKRNFKVEVIDANAENLSVEELGIEIEKYNPLLTAIIVYGSNPSASTQTMTIAGKISKFIKSNKLSKVALAGLHPSALPKRTLEEEDPDFVIEGEGFYTLQYLLEKLKRNSSDFSTIPGLWYKNNNIIVSNNKATLISNLDEDLNSAWELFPMHLYRAHNWHCFDDIDNRTPYAAIYTSLGCPFDCLFCCINTPFGKPGIRYKSPEAVIKEIKLLVTKYDVKNIKIIDELFILNEKHYMPIVEQIISEGFDLNIWAYSRIDTLKEEHLKKMKQAGINWLCVGVESANQNVLDTSSKKIKTKKIKESINAISDAGIYVASNYIFGLPDDDLLTMQETLDLAIDLNTEFVNFNCAMAYPGSKLYDMAIENKYELPKTWAAYSQYSYDLIPLPTKNLKAKQILEFRDNAFHKYFENPDYLNMVENKFGSKIKEHIQSMTAIQLKRRKHEVDK
jgi:anaerobic magnesium-protoporphyrin IX monomethyl ester cyclase